MTPVKAPPALPPALPPAKPAAAVAPTRPAAARQAAPKHSTTTPPPTSPAKAPVSGSRIPPRDLDTPPLAPKRIAASQTVPTSRSAPALPAILLQPELSAKSLPSSRPRTAARRLPSLPPTLFENDPTPVKPARIAPASELPDLSSIAVSDAAATPPSNLTPTATSAFTPTTAATPGTTSAPAPHFQLWLVARDSFTVVAHWTPPGAQLQQLSAGWGPGTWRIRVWLEAAGDTAATEVALDLRTHPNATYQFIPVLRAGQPYQAEIGFRNSDGHWRSAARSGAVATPADHGSTPAGRPTFATYRPEATPTVPSRETGGRAAVEPASHPPTTSDVAASPASGRPSRPARVAVEHRLHLVEQEFLRHTPGSSAEVVKSQNQTVESVTNYLPAEYEQGQESAESAASALPSSAAPSVPARPRGFWFEVNAELIVHGRTEPDAQVTLGGRPVKLRGDGSFTFRFALPDGDFSLPAVAIAAAGDDQRSALLRFIRNTQYEGHVGTHPIAPQLQPPVPESIP